MALRKMTFGKMTSGTMVLKMSFGPMVLVRMMHFRMTMIEVPLC